MQHLAALCADSCFVLASTVDDISDFKKRASSFHARMCTQFEQFFCFLMFLNRSLSIGASQQEPLYRSFSIRVSLHEPLHMSLSLHEPHCTL